VEGTESFRSKEKLAFKALRTYLRASLKIGVDRQGEGFEKKEQK